MKTTTLIDRYKEENTETESQIEFDNGVHPLHWATSPGPSPMGTDPLNLFKMVQKWFWNQLQQLQTECCTKSLRPLFWKLQLAFGRQRKLKYNRECRLQKKHHLRTSQTPQASRNRETKLCGLTTSSFNVARTAYLSVQSEDR